MRLSLPEDSALLSPDFLFGVATSSFQIEGNADKRLASIWDTFCRQPGRIGDGSDATVACDHYTRWADDLELLNYLGVGAYRFSLSWPRIVREDGSPSPKGLDFYSRILDRLNDNDIRPFVTLYHWDLPQYLQDAGGWLSRDTAKRFADYADIVSHAFGDRVHAYATLNEPYCSAYLGFHTGEHAPGLAGSGREFEAGHNLLLAHGLALPVLRGNCPSAQHGIVINLKPCYPGSESAADAAATEAADHVLNRWFLEPLLNGRYAEPAASRLASLGEQALEADLARIAQPLDYLGINYYTRAVCRAADVNGFELVLPEAAAATDMGWEIYPQGLTELLTRIDRDYDLPPLYITENGAATPDRLVGGEVRDGDRVRYLQLHLDALDAAVAGGVDVRGYFCWSLMDNFEWAWGYSKRFGIVHVDFETQVRTVKQSGHAYRDLLLSRSADRSAAG